MATWTLASMERLPTKRVACVEVRKRSLAKNQRQAVKHLGIGFRPDSFVIVLTHDTIGHLFTC